WKCRSRPGQPIASCWSMSTTWSKKPDSSTRRPRSDAVAYADLSPGAHADNVRCHWWRRPGWSDDSQFYTWHLTFENGTELHRLVADYQRKLGELPGLALVPQSGLHLTMQGIGFVDQVSDDVVTAITGAVRRRLRDRAPFALLFRPAV